MQFRVGGMKIVSQLAVLLVGLLAAPVAAFAHPHVFVEANMEVLRNAKGEFTEIRHVWRFDELFSTSIIFDYDENGDNQLDETELGKVTDIVKESIAEYDFYTAVRHGTDALEFYEPDGIGAYYEGNSLIMFLALELAKPLKPGEKPLRLSASDTSYYVAFDFDTDNVTVAGNNEGCNIKVEHPDFDKLYAEDSLFLTEAYFNDPNNPVSLGDEFYSWASLSCS